MYRYAIFDLDGTLLYTIPDLTDSVNGALAHFGLPPRTEAEVQSFIGSGRTNLMRRASGLEDEETLEKLCLYYDELYGANYHRRTTAYAGIYEALQVLQDAGIRMAVLSNKQNMMTVNLIAECLPGIRFDAVFGQRAGVPLKPDPTAVREIMALMGAAAEETAYFGDSDVDVRTALNAGAGLFAVTWGFRSEETLRAAGAERMLRSPSEIPGVFGL